MNLIEEGMITIDEDGDESTITSVERGQHGLLVKRKYDNPIYGPGEDFIPWECSLPEKPGERWYGWFHHYLIIQGIKIGMVAAGSTDGTVTIEDYDTRMKETWEAIRKEEQDEMSTFNNSYPN